MVIPFTQGDSLEIVETGTCIVDLYHVDLYKTNTESRIVELEERVAYLEEKLYVPQHSTTHHNTAQHSRQFTTTTKNKQNHTTAHNSQPQHKPKQAVPLRCNGRSG